MPFDGEPTQYDPPPNFGRLTPLIVGVLVAFCGLPALFVLVATGHEPLLALVFPFLGWLLVVVA